MEVPIQLAFANPPEEYLARFKETMGVTYNFGDYVVEPVTCILILVVTSLIFYGLALLNISRKSK